MEDVVDRESHVEVVDVSGDKIREVQHAIGGAIKRFIKGNVKIKDYVNFGKPKNNKVFKIGFGLRGNDCGERTGRRNLNIGGREIFVEVRVDGVEDFDGEFFAAKDARVAVRLVVGDLLLASDKVDVDKQDVKAINAMRAIIGSFRGASVEEIAETVVREAWKVVFF